MQTADCGLRGPKRTLMNPHLLIAVSAHGFGHIGQTAPVLQALRARLPRLKVTVRSAAPSFKIRERFGADIEHQSIQLDIGMIQRNALEVRVEESARAYRAFHTSWAERVAAEAEVLSALRPDLVLANVPYLSLAAATRCRVPAVALCSLSWADIYRHYCEGRRREAGQVLDEMLSSYNSALCFLQPEPSMPMRGIANGRPIGPIAQLGTARREELLGKIGAAPHERLIMISLGGMDARLPIENWRDLSGLRLIVPAAWQAGHPCATAFEDLGMPFADAMASCDALIGKPGYGSFVEAACLGLPVLYLERPDWPEAPYLVRWLERQGRCAPLRSPQIETGSIRPMLETLWSLPSPTVAPRGVDEAAAYLAGLLA